LNKPLQVKSLQDLINIRSLSSYNINVNIPGSIADLPDGLADNITDLVNVALIENKFLSLKVLHVLHVHSH